MADSAPVPSLDGFIHSPFRKLDRLLHYLLTTNKSQSNFFREYTKSLQYTLSRYSQNDARLRQEIQALLIDCLARYFTNVTVDVTVRPQVSDDTKIEVILRIVVEQDGESYSAHRLAEQVNSNFFKVTKINNG